jgi:probable phosphoglycerate mutase
MRRSGSSANSVHSTHAQDPYFVNGSLLDSEDDESLLDSSRIDGTIYLMRHGRTALDVQHRSDGWLDLPLSDNGQLELIESQQKLKTMPIGTVYTPDLKRTRETADLIKSGLMSDPKVVIDDDAKTWNLGVLAGTRKKYGRPEVQKLMANPSEKPLGGESYGEFCGRFLPWFEKCAAKVRKSGDPVLVICSGSNLRCLGSFLLSNPDEIDLDEGGLAALHYSAGAWHGEVLVGGEDDGEFESA